MEIGPPTRCLLRLLNVIAGRLEQNCLKKKIITTSEKNTHTYDNSLKWIIDVSWLSDCSFGWSLEEDKKNHFMWINLFHQWLTYRFATCSHDSNILNAGACPFSSMKILIKFIISSESLEMLFTNINHHSFFQRSNTYLHKYAWKSCFFPVDCFSLLLFSCRWSLWLVDKNRFMSGKGITKRFSLSMIDRYSNKNIWWVNKLTVIRFSCFLI